MDFTDNNSRFKLLSRLVFGWIDNTELARFSAINWYTRKLYGSLHYYLAETNYLPMPLWYYPTLLIGLDHGHGYRHGDATVLRLFTIKNEHASFNTNVFIDQGKMVYFEEDERDEERDIAWRRSCRFVSAPRMFLVKDNVGYECWLKPVRKDGVVTAVSVMLYYGLGQMKIDNYSFTWQAEVDGRTMQRVTMKCASWEIVISAIDSHCCNTLTDFFIPGNERVAMTANYYKAEGGPSVYIQTRLSGTMQGTDRRLSTDTHEDGKVFVVDEGSMTPLARSFNSFVVNVQRRHSDKQRLIDIPFWACYLSILSIFGVSALNREIGTDHWPIHPYGLMHDQPYMIRNELAHCLVEVMNNATKKVKSNGSIVVRRIKDQ
jgi:hypothetical protein